MLAVGWWGLSRGAYKRAAVVYTHVTRELCLTRKSSHTAEYVHHILTFNIHSQSSLALRPIGTGQRVIS